LWSADGKIPACFRSQHNGIAPTSKIIATVMVFIRKYLLDLNNGEYNGAAKQLRALFNDTGTSKRFAHN
jgi:hypothetical protein